MTFKFGKTERLVVALLAGSIGLLGCGGSSNGNPLPEGGETSDAAITVSPTNFDFGVVTEGNLENLRPGIFTISNAGETSYDISNIILDGDSTPFRLEESGDNATCNQRVFTLDPGESCTVAVSFEPDNSGRFDNAALTVEHNEPPLFFTTSSIRGTFEDLKELNVTVNQISACPRSQPAKAFVSVTDQGAFPIRGLTTKDFTLKESESGEEFGPDDARSVGDNGTNIALSIVMDYSGSISDVDQANMEEAATLLVDAMQANDSADIIKFADEVQCMLEEGFNCNVETGITSDQATLKEAIEEESGLVSGTAFYDATLIAIGRLKSQDADRRVVISLTDGRDTRSNQDADDTIDRGLETDIPVFTVGFGNVDVDELQMIADVTSGLFYNPAASDNLRQVYQQLANLLFEDQYVITFESMVPENEEGSLFVKAAFEDFEGEGDKLIQSCPQP